MANKTYIDKKGYPRFKDSGKLVHRWVVEKQKGRKIKKGHVVHHKDANKLNSKESNLKEMPRKSHSRLHAKERLRNRASSSGGLRKAIFKFLGF